jgi:GNAT superfamily N-acetyltransferase
MTDMLVKLYDLPELAPVLAQQRDQGKDIRRALAGEKQIVAEWVRERFSNMWASECEVAMSSQPCTCFVALVQATLVGFACYDTSAKGFFGPIGVAEQHRRSGIGTALLIACLHDMRAQGYGYAIIGWTGRVDFYRNAVGAVEIPDSSPGIYRGMLKD